MMTIDMLQDEDEHNTALAGYGPPSNEFGAIPVSPHLSEERPRDY